MKSEVRAELLARAAAATPDVAQDVGDWKWRLVGREVQMRNRKLPHMRLDLTLSEASELAEALCVALDEHAARPVVRVSLWGRLVDWLARRTWRRKHEAEFRFAMKQLVKDFEDSRGGW